MQAKFAEHFFWDVPFVNKGIKKGRDVKQSRPSPPLATVVGARSFLALLLFSSQELVRDPPYRARGSAYRIRDPAYRIRHCAYRSCRGCFFKHLYHLDAWFTASLWSRSKGTLIS